MQPFPRDFSVSDSELIIRPFFLAFNAICYQFFLFPFLLLWTSTSVESIGSYDLHSGPDIEKYFGSTVDTFKTQLGVAHYRAELDLQ